MPPKPRQRWQRSLVTVEASERVAESAETLRKALLEEAAASPAGQVDVERLQTLQQALALLNATVPARPSPLVRRLPMALLLVASAVGVALLMFTHRGTTEVFATFQASGFAVELAEPLAWAGPVRANSLSLSRYESLRAPFLESLLPVSDAPPAVKVSQLSLEPSDACAGTLTVELPRFGAGAVLTIHTLGERRLRLNGPAVTPGVSATLAGCWQVLRPGLAPVTVRLAMPQRLSVTADATGLDVVLQPRDLQQPWLLTPARVKALRFQRLDQRDAGDQTQVREVSTLIGGTLHFEELAERSISVRPGEALRWSAISGSILELRSGEGGLTVTVQGEVQGLRSGSAYHPRELMPTWLDWLRSNQAASLYWAAVISGFGMLAALRRWWLA